MTRWYAAIFAALLATGCESPEELRRLETELEKSMADVDVLKAQLATVQTEMQELKGKSAFDELVRDVDKIAYLTPGSDGYSIIRTDLGYLTISLSDVQPYANGSRVTFQLGNLTSATINGVKAVIEWGSVSPEGAPVIDSTRSREVTFTKSLEAGSWNNVSVVLEGIPPTALGFVRVKDVGHEGLRLKK